MYLRTGKIAALLRSDKVAETIRITARFLSEWVAEALRNLSLKSPEYPCGLGPFRSGIADRHDSNSLDKGFCFPLKDAALD